MASPLDSTARSHLAEEAAQLLFKRLKVTVKDGRELIGDFQCMDNYGNIILANTVEEAVIERRGQASREERNMGLVLIPIEQRQSCHLQVKPMEDVAATKALLRLEGSPNAS
ncbi:hypothetical protein WJX84_003875 [Apatococcus fuscideae]|uniref:Sm domain-containing protein n=1 Tax=Apatococcus fuscideae TaxID=2026836 RepID=A0AAW1RYD0_9CHLO